MSEYTESVKRIREFFEDQAKSAGGVWRDKFTSYANELKKVDEELVRLYGLTSALDPDLGNVHELPPELVAELNVQKADELEDQLVTVLNAYGRSASLDQILVGLYRRFKVVQKRRFVQNRLYRMAMVWAVPGKRGWYTLDEPDEPAEDKEDEGYERSSSYANGSSYGGYEQATGSLEDDEIPF